MSYEHYSIEKRLLGPGEKVRDVYIFHDASFSTIGSIIYLHVEGKTGDRRMEILKVGTKCGNNSTPVMEHFGCPYSIVLLQPLLAVLRQVAGPKLNFVFLSDSTCSLKLLKDDLLTTNKLSSNSKIQIEQMLMLSENFNEGVVRAIWVPGRLNAADIVTRAASNPVEVVNSSFYRHGILPAGIS